MLAYDGEKQEGRHLFASTSLKSLTVKDKPHPSLKRVRTLRGRLGAMDDQLFFLLDFGRRAVMVGDMKDKFYVVYESYTDYNQFEGSWDLQIEDFPTFKEAEDWIKTSWDADACRRHGAKIIGPLVLAVDPTIPKIKEPRASYSSRKKKS